MVIIFLLCLPILGYVGKYNLKKLGPVTDWLSVFFGSHFGKRNYDNVRETKENSIRMVESLERIEVLLDKLNHQTMIELTEEQKKQALEQDKKEANEFVDRLKEILKGEKFELVPEISVTQNGIVPIISVRRKSQ